MIFMWQVYEALLPKDFDRGQQLTVQWQRLSNLQPCHIILEAIKKFEKRNEFIVNKYKELKYTRPEDAEMILEESE